MLHHLLIFWFLIIFAQSQAAPVYLQIITVKAPERLDQVMAQLQSGGDFSELAQKLSTHSTAEDGGVWGPVRLNDLPEAVRGLIEKAGEGELLRFTDPAF